MKALRTAAFVIGAAALVASGVGAAVGAGILGGVAAGATTATFAGLTAATFTTIGVALSATAGVLSLAAGAAAPKGTVGGNATKFKIDKEAGIPVAIGRTYVGGNVVHRQYYNRPGDKMKNQLESWVTILSLGLVQSVGPLLIDKAPVAFDAGGQAIGTYRGNMWLSTQRGACPEAGALAGPFGAFPGWDGSSRLSGLAADLWTLDFDSKGEKFPNGVPERGRVLEGVLVYDPRLDSTYPGGNGPCRLGQPATYVYSECPGPHAITWAFGHYQNGVLVAGGGLAAQGIDLAPFVEWSNVCDANSWKVGGLVYATTDDAWDVLKMICQAGSARPLPVGAQLSVTFSAPRVSIGTISSADISGDVDVPATVARRTRRNTLIPSVRLESHGWEMVPLDPVSVPAYVAIDGGRRPREVSYPLVQDARQGAQLALYEMLNDRELDGITVPAKVYALGYRPGDCITLHIPEANLIEREVVVGQRELDVASNGVTLICRSEDSSKHAFALGKTTTPPPTPDLSNPGIDRAAPDAADWAAIGTTLTANGVSVPAIVITSRVDRIAAEEVVFDYRPHIAGSSPEVNWTGASIEPSSVLRKEITSVTANTAYDVGIRYRTRGAVSARLIIDNVTVGNSVVGEASNISPGGTIGGVYNPGTGQYEGGVPVDGFTEKLNDIRQTLADYDATIEDVDQRVDDATAQIKDAKDAADEALATSTNVNKRVDIVSSSVRRGGNQAGEFDPAFPLDQHWTDGPDRINPPVVGPEFEIGVAYDNSSCAIVAGGKTREIYSVATYPVDTSRHYKLSWRVGAWYPVDPGVPGPIVYLGLVGLDGAGNFVDHGGFGGTWRYAGMQGQRVPHAAVMQAGSATITGEGNDSYFKFPPGTKQVKLLALLNYPGSSGASPAATYLDYLRFEDAQGEVLAADVDGRVTREVATLAEADAALARESVAIEARMSERVSASARDVTTAFTEADRALTERAISLESSFRTGAHQAGEFDPAFPLDKHWASSYVAGATYDGTRAILGSAYDNASCLVVMPGTEYAQFFSKAYYPVDTSKRYRISCRLGAYRGAAPFGPGSLVYVGVVCLDGAGNYLDHGTYGTYRYSCITGERIENMGSMTARSQVMTGEGNDSWLKFAPGTKQVRIVILADERRDSPLATYFDYVRFEDAEGEQRAGEAVARANEVFATLTDGRFASAQRASVLEAQINRQTASPMNDAIVGVADSVNRAEDRVNARIETRATAIADDKAGAVAQTVEILRTEYNGRIGQVEQTAGSITDIDGRTSVYWSVTGTTNDGATMIQLTRKDGSAPLFYIGANTVIDGNLMVTGTVTTRVIQNGAVTNSITTTGGTYAFGQNTVQETGTLMMSIAGTGYVRIDVRLSTNFVDGESGSTAPNQWFLALYCEQNGSQRLVGSTSFREGPYISFWDNDVPSAGTARYFVRVTLTFANRNGTVFNTKINATEYKK